MPPRHAYWTILIGTSATSFRARDRAELVPTFEQIRARHPDAVLKWFARGRLWSSPEEARASQAGARRPPGRDRDWRPGGTHRDPRDRFRQKPDRGGPRGAGTRDAGATTPPRESSGGRPPRDPRAGQRRFTPKSRTVPHGRNPAGSRTPDERARGRRPETSGRPPREPVARRGASRPTRKKPKP